MRICDTDANLRSAANYFNNATCSNIHSSHRWTLPTSSPTWTLISVFDFKQLVSKFASRPSLVMQLHLTSNGSSLIQTGPMNGLVFIRNYSSNVPTNFGWLRLHHPVYWWHSQITESCHRSHSHATCKSSTSDWGGSQTNDRTTNTAGTSASTELSINYMWLIK